MKIFRTWLADIAWKKLGINVVIIANVTKTLLE
jgi:hypothetical protein